MQKKFKGVSAHYNKWRYRFSDHGKRYQVELDHYPRSQKELDALRVEMLRSDLSAYKDAASLTFQEAAERFLRESAGVLSPSTINGYKSMLRRLPDALLCRRLPAVGQAELNAVVRACSGMSPKTVRNMHGFALSVIHYYNPDFRAHTKLPVWNESDYYAPEAEDVKRILDAVAGTRYEVAYQLAVMGLRRSEICAADASDLDGDTLRISRVKVPDPDGGYTIKQSTKTGYTRDVILPHALAEKLRAQGRAFDGNPEVLDHHLRIVQARLGIDRFTFHKFRHYFVSQGSAMGIPDKYLQVAGGWRTDRVMKRRYLQAQKSKTLESGKKYVEFAQKLFEA